MEIIFYFLHIINDILEQWKNVYDKVYNDTDSNSNNFKSSFSELTLISSFYSDIYQQNIINNYVKSIVDIYKNDFNYTIKYYYNIILSKINKTYSLLLNKMPILEKPFDNITNKRNNEIRQSYINFLNEIKQSKSEKLTQINQLSILKVNNENFFEINSYKVSNIEEIKTQLGSRMVKLINLSNNHLKEFTEEIVVSRFYLENAQNGKQIKDSYEPINRDTFIDLQNDVCKKLFEKLWEIKQDEFINDIKNALINSNEILLNNFKFENEKYVTFLKNKIYKELFSEDNLYQEIKNIFSKGLKQLDINSKNIINGYFNEVINKIKSIISDEISTLSDKLTSYNDDYTKIGKTINYYKEYIYNEFYSNIISVVNEFNSSITEKFYKNYIEKSLDDYKNVINEENFKEFNFLNISFNLKNIINNNISSLIYSYKANTINQINSLCKNYIQHLDELFSFSNMKNKINTEINTIYFELINTLKEKYSPNYDSIVYDLPNQTDIDNFIKVKINETKQIIEKMKGDNYIFNYNKKANFSSAKEDLFNEIEKYFDNFTIAYSNKEKKEFKNIVIQNINNNFKLIIDNFIPSFASDFFDRILHYNEIQKIKSLYNNLKNSLTITNIYYEALCSIYSPEIAPINLPQDIKLKILTINNLDFIVNSKNNQVISRLQLKLNEFFNETKKYTVEKYIINMKNDLDIKLSFNNDILLIINQVINETNNSFVYEYNNMINNYIKNPFIEKYIETINKETNDMINFIENNRDYLRIKLNEIFTLNTDTILTDLEQKLNNTVKAINSYNSHFNSFKLSNEIMTFLDSFGTNIIFPKYKDIKEMLDNRTEEVIFKNLEINSQDFIKVYNYKIFNKKASEIDNNLTYIFKDMNKSLNNYGLTNEKYKKN